MNTNNSLRFVERLNDSALVPTYISIYMCFQSSRLEKETSRIQKNIIFYTDNFHAEESSTL